jgi:ketosteroid isomerase-like protein
MSQENVEIVRELYAAFARGDATAALDAFDEDVVLDASHRVDGRVGHGREELIAIVSEWMVTWDDWRQELEEARDLGDDRVLATSTQGGRGKGSGIEWEHRFAMLYEFERGKITRWTIFDDLPAALVAAGLSE